jgi:hypothetical protein
MEQELTQEGEVKEQVQETPSEPVSEATSPEEKATSEKQYSESEWRKMQSLKDKAEAKAQSHEKELQELRNKMEQQLLMERQKEIDALADDPDGLAKAKHKHKLEDDIRKLEEQRQDAESAVQRKYDHALLLAKEHNLSLADARELMDAGSPREMELMAQLKVAEQAKVQTKSPPKKEEGFVPDSNTSDAGTDDDKSFLKKWNSGELPFTKENLQRAQKIINK